MPEECGRHSISRKKLVPPGAFLADHQSEVTEMASRVRDRVLAWSLCTPGLMYLLPSTPVTIVRVALGSASWKRDFRDRRCRCAGKVSLVTSSAT